MEKCIRCDEELPALSKVCPFCGHINEGHSDVSIHSAIEKLESCIRAAKKIVSSSFSSTLKKYAWLFYLVLTIQLFVLAAVSLNYFAWFLVLLSFGLFIFSFSRLFRKDKGQNNLNVITAEYTSCKNDIVRYFGESKEVKKQIVQADEEFNDLLEKQRAGKLKYNLLSLLSVIGVLCISGIIIFNLSRNIARDDASQDESMLTEYLNENKYEKAIQAFPAVALNSIDEGASAKTLIINKLVSAKEYNLAISFFDEYCIGHPDDFGYAEIIVNDMLKAGYIDDAYNFIEGCTGLYYKTDRQRLINLITK